MKPKRYQCKECGYEKMISTNHYRKCYSLGYYNACPGYHLMPPDPKHPESIVRKVTTWICQETPPKGAFIPEPWTITTIEDLLK